MGDWLAAFLVGWISSSICNGIGVWLVCRWLARYPKSGAIQLVTVDGVQARFDRSKGILIDPPFGPWPRS